MIFTSAAMKQIHTSKDMRGQRRQTKAEPEKCKIKVKPTPAYSGVPKSESSSKPWLYHVPDEWRIGARSVLSRIPCHSHCDILFTFLPNVAHLDSGNAPRGWKPVILFLAQPGTISVLNSLWPWDRLPMSMGKFGPLSISGVYSICFSSRIFSLGKGLASLVWLCTRN